LAQGVFILAEIAQRAGDHHVIRGRTPAMTMWHDVIELQPEAREARVLLCDVIWLPWHSVRIEAMCQFSNIGMNNGNTAVSAPVTVTLKYSRPDCGRNTSVGIAQIL
jgi:hypothetical protein